VLPPETAEGIEAILGQVLYVQGKLPGFTISSNYLVDLAAHLEHSAAVYSHARSLSPFDKAVEPRASELCNAQRSTLTTFTTPLFIDSASYLCNFEENRATYGNGRTLWRCIGNSSDDVGVGSSGKWYYPILLAGKQNKDFAGEFLAINSADYPVDTSETYIIVDNGDGVYVYARLMSQNQNQLSAIDSVCTGTNNTEASTRCYATWDDSSDPSDPSDSSDSSDPSDFSDSSALESSSSYAPSSEDQSLSIPSSSSAFRSVLGV
jgi:hypothetical protein